MKTPAYRVEARGEGCPTCQQGDQFDIIGPDDAAQSQSWGDVEEAEYICELLNSAYSQGRADFAKQILIIAGGETNEAEAQPQVEEPQQAKVAPPLDEDIPF